MKIYMSSYLTTGDNSVIINRRIELAKERNTLVFPNGKFNVLKTLIQNNKGLNWEGAEETELIFNHPDTALRLIRTQSTYRTNIEGIDFLSRFNGDSNTQHGIHASIPITIKNCLIENFHGDGVRLTADVLSTPAADVSFSKLSDLVIRSCTGNGIYIQGGDSNAGSFERIDIRDNGGYGALDAGFLGNRYAGCMAHLNKKGDYAATDVNNRSTYEGCYSEEGHALSYFHGQAQIHGGLWGGGVALEHNAKAYIDGQVYDAQNNRYDFISNEVYKNQMIKIFKRNREPFEFQWRVYNIDGDVFEEKSFENLTKDEAINKAREYLDLKTN